MLETSLIIILVSCKVILRMVREYILDSNQQLQLDKDFERELIHGYYACVTFIDFQIGKIIKKLNQSGLMDNTIIVVWGDHGYHFGDHRLWNKHSNFEQATRSPLIIYNPKTKTAQKIVTPTEFVDVFPTLIDLANLNHLITWMVILFHL